MLSNLVNEHFVKGALTYSIISMLLLASLTSVFFPGGQDMSDEMRDLLGSYEELTGSQPYSEEIWGLTGIYTPMGVGSDGAASDRWGTTDDGWIYGAKIAETTPSQLAGLPGQSFTARLDRDTGLYYYTASEGMDVRVAEDPDNPQEGELYSMVMMDRFYKSDVFFTSGTKEEMENGTFKYDFSGWRYAFQPLRSYDATNGLHVDRTTSSLSLIWYGYPGAGYTGDGLSGQLILSGSDSGIAYITAPQILEAFNQATMSARFDMTFNAVDMHVYIKMHPVAMQSYTVEECYNYGYWYVLVTSPSVSANAESGLSLSGFAPDKVLDTTIALLTFHMDDYGLTGFAGTLASIAFSASFYTSLIAIGLSVWPVLILAGILGVIQAWSVLVG